MSDTLVAFLLARIAEDEAVARDLLGAEYRPRYRHEGYAAMTWSNPDYIEEGVSLSPERMLAECEAKRRIVDWAFVNAEQIDGEWGDACLEADLRAGRCDNYGMWAVEDVLKLLALPYADHPDYRPEWAP